MNAPPFTPMSSLGEELGIMFAFSGSMILTAVVYALIWRHVQRRKEAEEKLRREKLNAVLRAREAERNDNKERKIAVDPSAGMMKRAGSPLSISLLNTQDDDIADVDLSSSNAGDI
ncbi:hypothetical protein KEM54_002939 [Ascosphaera aggregata]|nr:hypothetical protein KEM54_002939 [Ascosphaera aggregata]